MCHLLLEKTIRQQRICIPLSQKICILRYKEISSVLYCRYIHCVSRSVFTGIHLPFSIYTPVAILARAVCGVLLCFTMPILLDADADPACRYGFVVAAIDAARTRVFLLRRHFSEEELHSYASTLYAGRMAAINAHGSLSLVIPRWHALNTCRYCQCCFHHMHKCACCWAKYCSQDCMRADWIQHKKYCRLITDSLKISADNGQRSERARIKLATFWGKDHCHRTYPMVLQYEYQMTRHLILTVLDGLSILPRSDSRR